MVLDHSLFGVDVNCAPVICSVAAGFIDADDAAHVASAVAVESTYGLKST